jgi:hypothetical protein
VANGRLAARVVERVQVLPPVLRASVLAAPDCITGLATHGQRRTSHSSSPPWVRAAGDGACSRGSHHGAQQAGLDAQVMSLIDALPASLQARPLSASGAVHALAKNRLAPE